MGSKQNRKSSRILKQTTLFRQRSPQGSVGRRSTRARPIPDNDSLSEAEELPSAKKQRKNFTIHSDDSQPVVSSAQHPKVKIGQQKPRRPAKAQPDSSDNEAAPDSPQARKRKRRILKRSRAQIVSENDDDDGLVDEVDKDRILETRLRARNKTTTFQKNLAKLKRRKEGKPPGTSSSEQSESEEESENGAPFRDARSHSDRDSLFDEDSDASHPSDFIVEDDDTVPTALPAQFSMDSHQDLSTQFKKVFQFFVHVAVRPAIERRDFMKQQIREEEYFSVPLQITRRKISGLRDSLVASSVWRPDFKGNLEKYPEFDLIPLDFAVPQCDACHLGGRMSTLIGRLSGFPYDRLGFNNVDTSDSENDEDEAEPESELSLVEYHLGRFCGKRTRVFHEFTHWEYSLFKNILQEVDDLHASNQSGGFFRIAYAGGRSPPEDLSDADGIYEWLDERKLIDVEWHKVKDMMESARHLDLARKGDGVD